jgi:hypothetical protein
MSEIGAVCGQRVGREAALGSERGEEISDRVTTD